MKENSVGHQREREDLQQATSCGMPVSASFSCILSGSVIHYTKFLCLNSLSIHEVKGRIVWGQTDGSLSKRRYAGPAFLRSVQPDFQPQRERGGNWRNIAAYPSRMAEIAEK